MNDTTQILSSGNGYEIIIEGGLVYFINRKLFILKIVIINLFYTGLAILLTGRLIYTTATFKIAQIFCAIGLFFILPAAIGIYMYDKKMRISFMKVSDNLVYDPFKKQLAKNGYPINIQELKTRKKYCFLTGTTEIELFYENKWHTIFSKFSYISNFTYNIKVANNIMNKLEELGIRKETNAEKKNWFEINL